MLGSVWQGGAHMVGACVAGGMHGRNVCGGRCAWQGGHA